MVVASEERRSVTGWGSKKSVGRCYESVRVRERLGWDFRGAARARVECSCGSEFLKGAASQREGTEDAQGEG